MLAMWPAGVLGPLVSRMRFSLFIPLLTAMLALSTGRWSHWAIWAILLLCIALLVIAVSSIPTRRLFLVEVNLVFAVMLFIGGLLWNSLVGSWWGVATGLSGGLWLLAADRLARWGISRLAVDNPGGCRGSASIEIGVLWGFVEASVPAILGLNDGSLVRLPPGHRYAWWLGAEAKEPRELLVAIDTGGDFSAN